jgi:hypothetical protein
MAKLGQTKANAKKRTIREREYDRSRIDARVERNRARRKAIREGKVSVGDSKVVNHKKSIKKNGVTAAKKGGTTIQSKTASNKQGARISNRRQ